LLVKRGIHSFEQARVFFRPEWECLHSPFLMADMDKAVSRLIRAVENKEKILVFGDYDVDGITSVSLFVLFIRARGGEVDFYIPDRLKEGYGLSRAGVEQAGRIGASLLLTVDCGINAVEEVEMARASGIDVIVCDHHEPGETLPLAYAVLDPKRTGCPYPFKELAGVGVTFKLVQGISEQLGLDPESYRQYVDLAALGSTADIVPLVDENRLLVKKGLEKINRHERLGVRALIECAGLAGKEIGTGQVVFVLAPRINAVGRLGNAERAVRLLTTESETEAVDIAKVLEAENRHRKEIDEETFSEAMDLVDSSCDLVRDRAVVLAKDDWHAGVIGIVASRIVEQVGRPTVMIAVENGMGKGSARSIPAFDLFSALKRCERHLVGFGGHRHAAGLSIRVEDIDAFREAFNAVASEMLTEEDLDPKIWIDAQIRLPDITDSFVRVLNQFAPFGPHNMRPLFLAKDLSVVGTPTVVGKNHLKFKVKQSQRVFDAIGFNLGPLGYRLSPGEGGLEAAFVIEENHWNGQDKMQLRIKDFR
jgi:single-stranded-DNA-specific exonuclease